MVGEIEMTPVDLRAKSNPCRSAILSYAHVRSAGAENDSLTRTDLSIAHVQVPVVHQVPIDWVIWNDFRMSCSLIAWIRGVSYRGRSVLLVV